MSSIGALSQIATSFFSKVYNHEQPTRSETAAVKEALSASVDAQLIQDMRVNSLATELSGDKTIVKIVTQSGDRTTTEIKLSDASLFDFTELDSTPSLSTIETLNVAGLGTELYARETTNYNNSQVEESLNSDSIFATNVRV